MQQEKPRSGRPKSEAKRENILAAGKQVFLEDGFAASLDRVAALADVSKQTIYTHFGSKEGLYRAVAEGFRSTTEGKIDPAQPLEAVLMQVGLTMLEKFSDPNIIRFHRQVIGQAEQFPDLAKVHDEFGAQVSLNRLAERIAKDMAEGTLRAADPLIAADQFLGMVQGTARIRTLFGAITALGTSERQRHVEQAVAAFLRAYGA